MGKQMRVEPQQQNSEDVNGLAMVEGLERLAMESGNARMSIKAVNDTQFGHRSIGASLPMSRQETDFMYQWTETTETSVDEMGDLKERSFVDTWRQRWSLDWRPSIEPF